MEILKRCFIAGALALLFVSCEGNIDNIIGSVGPDVGKDTTGVVEPPKDTTGVVDPPKDTTEVVVPPVGVTTRVWYELPVIADADGNGIDDNNSDLYYAYHLCDLRSPSGHKARNYAVCFSAEHHCPYWVSAPRHDM